MTPKRVQNRSQNHPEAHQKGNRKNIGNSTLIWIEAGACRQGRVNLKLAGDGKRKVCERCECCGDVFVVAAFC